MVKIDILSKFYLFNKTTILKVFLGHLQNAKQTHK